MNRETLGKPALTPASVDKSEDKNRPWSVVLYDDPVNTMRHVVACLVQVCGHNPVQAKSIMMAAHIEGKTICKTCPFEHAEAIREQLEVNGLTATIEQT